MTRNNESAQSSPLAARREHDTARIHSDIDQFSAIVWSLAKRCLHNDNEAALVVQAVFTDLWRDNTRPDDQPIDTVWVIMMTRARLIKQMTPGDKSALSASLPDNLSKLAEHMEVSPARLASNGTATQAGKALAALDPAARQALTLAVALHLDHGEIATGTDQSEQTVQRNVRHGLLSVCQFLANTPKTTPSAHAAAIHR